MVMLKAADSEVRSNSVFAMGVLAANGGEAVQAYPFPVNGVMTWVIPQSKNKRGIIYSGTSILRPPMGPRKCGLMLQVVLK